MIFKKLHFKTVLPLVLGLVLALSPLSLFAQVVQVDTSKTTIETDDTVLVTVYLNTKGQSINTLSGSVNYDASAVSVSDIRYGNSIISLWVDKPTASNGSVKFTGGIPGGYNGSHGLLFTFTAKPKKQGSVSFSVTDSHLLLNDGSGEEAKQSQSSPAVVNVVPNTAPSAPASVKSTNSPSTKQVQSTTTTGSTGSNGTTTPEVPVEVVPILEPDVIAPETFVPMVGHHPSINDDAYFVSFSAVDKDSGIARYEIRETPTPLTFFGGVFATNWVGAISPYALHYQKWGSRVEVKAYDQAGNFAVSTVDKPFDSTTSGVVSVVVVALVAYVTRRITLKKHTHRSK